MESREKYQRKKTCPSSERILASKIYDLHSGIETCESKISAKQKIRVRLKYPNEGGRAQRCVIHRNHWVV